MMPSVSPCFTAWPTLTKAGLSGPARVEGADHRRAPRARPAGRTRLRRAAGRRFGGRCIGMAATGPRARREAMAGAGCTAAPIGVRARRTDSLAFLDLDFGEVGSSSRSISFLILRRSIVFSFFPLPHAERVPRVRATTTTARWRRRGHSGRNRRRSRRPRPRQVAEIALAAERFAGVRIGQVDFYERNRDRGQGIAQR